MNKTLKYVLIGAVVVGVIYLLKRNASAPAVAAQRDYNTGLKMETLNRSVTITNPSTSVG
jgi:hypothetical protein